MHLHFNLSLFHKVDTLTLRLIWNFKKIPKIYSNHYLKDTKNLGGWLYLIYCFTIGHLILKPGHLDCSKVYLIAEASLIMYCVAVNQVCLLEQDRGRDELKHIYCGK